MLNAASAPYLDEEGARVEKDVYLYFFTSVYTSRTREEGTKSTIQRVHACDRMRDLNGAQHYVYM